MARFNIQDVVSLHGIIPYSKRGSEYYFICPVCGEKGACSYNPDKNTWHDWKCDAGGGPIELHMAMERDLEKLSVFEGTDGKKAAARDIEDDTILTMDMLCDVEESSEEEPLI